MIGLFFDWFEGLGGSRFIATLLTLLIFGGINPLLSVVATIHRRYARKGPLHSNSYGKDQGKHRRNGQYNKIAIGGLHRSCDRLAYIGIQYRQSEKLCKASKSHRFYVRFVYKNYATLVVFGFLTFRTTCPSVVP